MGSGNDGRTLTQTEGIWLSASRNLECSDMGEITITDRPAHPRRAARSGDAEEECPQEWGRPEGTRPGRLLYGLPDDDHRDLAWTMHAAHQNLLDIGGAAGSGDRSEEHTSELQSPMY